jgi:hypothetical protein
MNPYFAGGRCQHRRYGRARGVALPPPHCLPSQPTRHGKLAAAATAARRGTADGALWKELWITASDRPVWDRASHQLPVRASSRATVAATTWICRARRRSWRD